MKRRFAVIILIIILAAALLMPDEAGERFSRDPYLVVIDADGNIVHEEYMSAEDCFKN